MNQPVREGWPRWSRAEPPLDLEWSFSGTFDFRVTQRFFVKISVDKNRIFETFSFFHLRNFLFENQICFKTGLLCRGSLLLFSAASCPRMSGLISTSSTQSCAVGSPEFLRKTATTEQKRKRLKNNLSNRERMIHLTRAQAQWKKAFSGSDFRHDPLIIEQMPYQPVAGARAFSLWWVARTVATEFEGTSVSFLWCLNSSKISNLNYRYFKVHEKYFC